MCCLFGMLGNMITSNEQNAMKYMSYLACFRGVDSTGVIIGTNEKKRPEVTWCKDTLTPPEFFHGSEYESLMLKARNVVLLAGHARAATKGLVTLENTHPFEARDIIGMHNGTIHTLATKPGGTDSEAAMNLIATEGIQETVNKSKNGAYAFMWVDTEKNTVNFIRNAQRPLWFMRAPGNLVLWMSEKWMLGIVAAKMGWADNKVEYLNLIEDHHVVFKLGDTHCKTAVTKPKEEPWSYQRQPLKVDDLFKNTHHTSTPNAYPYQVKAEPGTRYGTITPKIEPLPMLPAPPKVINVPPPAPASGPGRVLRRVGPWLDCSDEDLDRCISEGCVNCNEKVSIDPATRQSMLRSTVFFLPDPEKDIMKTVYFCFNCKVNLKAHKTEWYLEDRDLVRGGLLHVTSH